MLHKLQVTLKPRVRVWARTLIGQKDGVDEFSLAAALTVAQVYINALAPQYLFP